MTHTEENLRRGRANVRQGLLQSLRLRVTGEVTASREPPSKEPPAGLRAWFARVHWVLVASVATSQLVAFGGGVSKLVQPSSVAPAARPVRQPARPLRESALGQNECEGIRLGEVLLDARGEPVFATLSAKGQAYQFPRRIGDHLGGNWTLSHLSVSKMPSEPSKLEARVELKAAGESCILATHRVREGHYSAAL